MPDAIPFVDLSRTVRRLQPDIDGIWKDCLNECEFIGQQSVAELESQLSRHLNVQNVICCANGTDALVIALKASGVTAGMKVALPNLTFWATFEAVVHAGGTPVLIDCDPIDLQMNFSELRLAHQKHSLQAVVLAHLFGWTSHSLSKMRNFCQEEGILVIEDSAQAFGVISNGRSIFSDARIATLSFYPAKVIGGSADGGAITTPDPELAQICRKLINHGRTSHYSYSHVGWNSRMSGLNSRYLSTVLKFADQILKDRLRLHREYSNFARQTLQEFGITNYDAPKDVTGNGYLAVMTTAGDHAAALVERLKAARVNCGRIYPETIDQQMPAKNALRVSDLVFSKTFVKRVVNLPLFWGMTQDEQDQICRTFKAVLSSND